MRPFIQQVIFFIVCLFGSGVTLAQQGNEVMANRIIDCVVKDHNGLMWVGTQNGLQTFDGYGVGGENYLQKHIITKLVEDRVTKRLWIGTTKGLFYYDYRTGTIVSRHDYSLYYSNFTNGADLSCQPYSELNTVTNIVTGNGSVYVSFDRRPYVLKISRSDVTTLIRLTECRFVEESVNVIFAGGEKLFYVSGRERVEYDERSGKRVSMGVWDIGPQQSFMMLNHNLLLYVNDHSRIRVYDYKRRKFVTDHPLDKRWAVFLSGNNDRIFFTTNNQLFVLHKGDTVVKSIYSDQANKVFTSLYTDEYNTTWIGSRKGLIKVSEEEAPTMQSFLRGVSIRQIVSDSDFLYVGTYKGVFRYAKNGRHSEKDSQWYKQSIRALWNDTATGYLYAGGETMFPTNLVRYNKRTGVIESGFYKGEIIRHYVLSITKDKYNTIWVGSSFGLYSIKNGTAKYYKEIGPEEVRFLYWYKKRNMLIASGMNVLNIIDVQNGGWQRIPLPHSEADNNVSYVEEGMDGNIWVGTNTNGLYVLSPDFKVINHISVSDGLPNNCINGLIWENEHRIWVSTNQGLCLYNLGTGKSVTYHLEDGIADEEFNQNSFFKDGDRRFYFGSINGVTTFDPNSVSVSDRSFNVFASDIEKWGASKSYTLNRMQEELVLNPGEYYLTLSFGISNYATPAKNRFYYRINGIHNEWVLMREQNTLVINGLAPGEYTLEVRAVNMHGILSSNTLVYTVIAKQVFYKTGWFVLLLVLLACGGMYLYFRWRLGMIRKMQDVRTQIASHLHDEVGGTLTSIAMMSEQLSGTNKPVDETKLKKIARLSREVTLSMSDVLWSIDGRNDSTANLASRMKEQAEDMLLAKGIRLFFDFSSKQESLPLKPEDRQHFFLIFKEALNNIVKHSNATYVKIHYSYMKGSFLLQIENDGVEHFNRERSGQGLRNIEMRARMLGASAIFEHHNGIVSITIEQV